MVANLNLSARETNENEKVNQNSNLASGNYSLNSVEKCLLLRSGPIALVTIECLSLFNKLDIL